MAFQLCNVQQKISCCFDTVVVEEPASKRAHQSYKVVAGDTLRLSACESAIKTAHPSEKLDGTCVYIDEFQGKPWLWARHDRKPNKSADRRFKKFQTTKRLKEKDIPKQGTSKDSFSHELEDFVWDVEKDFKEILENWVPADGVPLKDGVPQPDKAGHIPGWVPVNPAARQHCWHLTTVDLLQGMGLVLQPRKCNGGSGDNVKMQLEIMTKPLSELVGCTMELIGTFINGNPYCIGSKQAPLHLLVRHGILLFNNPPPLDYIQLKDWFLNEAEGRVEGLVWHCTNGQMFKLHRHHLQLKWPIENVRLQSMSVIISVKEFEMVPESLFEHLSKLDGKEMDSLTNVDYKL